MTSTTGLLCLVAALMVSTDSCTECIRCLNTNGIKCDCEQTVQCPNGCATFSEYSIVQNRPVSSIKMDCAPDGLTEAVTFGFNDAAQLKAQVHIAPCTGDYCNKNMPFHYDPKGLGPPNGLYCESCFLENSKVKECNSCDRVACRGGQTQCLSVSTTFQRGNGVIADYVVKGCVTEYICLVKFGIIPQVKDERNHCVSDLDCIVKFLFLPSTKILDERTFKCTKATTSARDCSGCKGKNFYY